MTSDYTPSTDEVRNEYIDTANPSWLDEEIGREFDRWLQHVKAEAWNEGFESGHYVNEEESRDCGCRNNPYKKENNK